MTDYCFNVLYPRPLQRYQTASASEDARRALHPLQSCPHLGPRPPPGPVLQVLRENSDVFYFQASPIPVLAIFDIKNIMRTEEVCEMNNQQFLIFGSLLAFYIPMVIMVTTYVLTVHHLKKQKLSTLSGARHQISKNGNLAVTGRTENRFEVRK